MNISYKWLKEYTDIPLNPDELSTALTSIGLETGGVERVETIRGGLRGIVIGKVLTCTEHPDSDHLHITTVDLTGKPGDEPTQIVCGAPNVAAGQTVVVATVGTTLYDGDQEFKIKKSKIRGVESFGMICAEDEIGVGTSHDGIIVLPAEAEAFVGRPAAEYYRLEDDYILEVDITPNRIDAASHYGVARDYAAWATEHLQYTRAHKPSVEGFRIDRPDVAGVAVEVQCPEMVTRYAGVTIKGVKVAESPEWLKDRLSAIGLRPINNIVDITNYILHAFCQPLHCFDANTLSGNKVVVRRAHKDEKIVTLDEVERTLTQADLMICDDSRSRCIAGVFGGLDSGTTENTTDVFLESACFNPTAVRKTARRLGLNTDSSFRFERGVDPNGTLYALKLAALMVKELAGGEFVGDVVDYYPAPVQRAEVHMQYSDFSRVAGADIPRDSIDSILDSLEIERTETAPGQLTLRVPTYRVDVTRPCDVIEDVLRVYGYNNIPMGTELHACLSYKTETDAIEDLRRTIADQLTGAGYNEILNNSLTAEGYYQGLETLSPERCVHLLNPLSQDLNVMRQTLLFGGLETIAHNVNRRAANLALYEFGNVYFNDPAKEITAEHPLAPFSEHRSLALWLTGELRPASWLRGAEGTTFYDLKGEVANVLARTGLKESEIVLKKASNELFTDAMEVSTRSGKVLGWIGVVSPGIAKRCDVKVPVYYAEFNWDAVCSQALARKVSFTPLPRTQDVLRDLSLLIDKTVTMADIEAVVRRSERRLLRNVELFDVYEGDKLPQGKKSYAIKITLRDDEKTLQDKQIDQTMAKIIANLTKELGAELR